MGGEIPQMGLMGVPHLPTELLGYTTYYILHTTYYTLYTIYYILHTTYYILHTTYYILHTTYYTLYTIYYILYTTYYTLHTIYYILYTPYYILTPTPLPPQSATTQAQSMSMLGVRSVALEEVAISGNMSHNNRHNYTNYLH
jgi:hypothetical protein